MFIKFTRLRFKNLLSYGSLMTELSLDTHGCTLVAGANGAGKSAFLDALHYALYGKPYRDITLPQFINSVNGKDLVVEVEFERGDSKFVVKRGIKPKLFEIWQDGVLLHQSAAEKDYQAILTKNILGMTDDVFRQVIILGSNFTPFMSLKAEDRRAVIENILGIEVFSVMRAIWKDKVKLIDAEFSKVEREIRVLEDKIAMKKEFDSKSSTAVQEKVDDIQAKLKIMAAEAIDLKASRDTLTAQIAPLAEELSTKRREISAKIRKYEDYRRDIINNKNRTVEERRFFTDNTVCPTCTQPMAEAHAKSHICKHDDAIAKFDVGLEKLRKAIEDANKEASALDGLDKQVLDLNTELRAVATKESSAASVRMVHEANLRKFTAELLALSKNNSDELGVWTADLEAKKLEYAAVKDKLAAGKVAEEILKDTGIRASVVSDYLPVINTTINQYLDTLGLAVAFTLDSSFKETVRSRYRDTFCYENFSEGQKARINIAILLTWRNVASMRNSVSTNLLVLDEVFDGSLDKDGADELLRVLCYHLTKTNTIIITHKQDEMSGKTKIDRYLNVVRLGEFSEIIEVKN